MRPIKKKSVMRARKKYNTINSNGRKSAIYVEPNNKKNFKNSLSLCNMYQILKKIEKILEIEFTEALREIFYYKCGKRSIVLVFNYDNIVITLSKTPNPTIITIDRSQLIHHEDSIEIIFKLMWLKYNIS